MKRKTYIIIILLIVSISAVLAFIFDNTMYENLSIAINHGIMSILFMYTG